MAVKEVRHIMAETRSNEKRDKGGVGRGPREKCARGGRDEFVIYNHHKFNHIISLYYIFRRVEF